MNSIAAAVETVRATVNRSVAPQVLPDLCDITQIELVSDGHSGQTEGETPVATNIPVEVSEASPNATAIVAGDQTYQATHRLKFGWNATTAAINPKQVITVQARGDQGAMVFEMPVREKGSKSVWLFCSAKLTTGFRSPAAV